MLYASSTITKDSLLIHEIDQINSNLKSNVAQQNLFSTSSQLSSYIIIVQGHEEFINLQYTSYAFGKNILKKQKTLKKKRC